MYRTLKNNGKWTMWFPIEFSARGLRRKLNKEKYAGRIQDFEIKDIQESVDVLRKRLNHPGEMDLARTKNA